jgi:hypothetical protein
LNILPDELQRALKRVLVAKEPSHIQQLVHAVAIKTGLGGDRRQKAYINEKYTLRLSSNHLVVDDSQIDGTICPYFGQRVSPECEEIQWSILISEIKRPGRSMLPGIRGAAISLK